MKLTILLLAFTLAVLTSCTTSYKTGQTPDDVYYSPVRPQEEYVQSEKEEEKRYDDEYYEDRYTRMKVRNRTRWNELDDWYYNDYRYRSNVYLGCCFCNTGWSPHAYWNSYYNPYYQNYVIVKTVKTPVYNKPRTFNLNAYNTSSSNTKNYSNTKNVRTSSGSNNSSYNGPRNTSRNDDSGNRLRDIFKNNSSSSSSSGSSNNSSSTKPNTSSSSSSSSSSGSSQPAPVRRF